jgi:hypothetical protein
MSRAVMGRLDDEDEIFNRFDASDAGIEKKSAQFHMDPTERVGVQRIPLEDSDANTFGRVEQSEVFKSSAFEGDLNKGGEQYKTFKQNAKYNKYVKDNKPKVKLEDNGLDKNAKAVLANDDLGEAGEWAGTTLNRNAAKNKEDDEEADSEEQYKMNNGKSPDDDEFDFDAPAKKSSPTAEFRNSGVAGVPAEKNREDDLRQKIQKKLDGTGPVLRTGGGVGMLNNRLANKQKELEEKKDKLPPIIGKATPTIVESQEHTESDSKSKNPTQLVVKTKEIVPPQKKDFITPSFVPKHDAEDDEWEMINMVNKKNAATMRQSQ